jgi:hypothetical protein
MMIYFYATLAALLAGASFYAGYHYGSYLVRKTMALANAAKVEIKKL